MAAGQLDELHALLLRRCAGDAEAMALLEAPDWAAATSRAAALRVRQQCPPGLREAVLPAGEGEEDDCGDERTLAMLRLAHRAWDGAVPREDDVVDPALRAWRRRQRARCDGQLTRRNVRGILHLPLAFTLTRGCSVQCWFCAQAAPPLDGVFRRTPANARLWREVLAAAGDVIGPAAATGACYAGSEPFDNPDYELFASDFHDVLGQFPQTTTARALADPARTRALLALSLHLDGPRNRFSILSAPMLRRLYAEFTPEELLLVELIPQVKGGVRKWRAGRAREARAASSARGAPPEPGTSACLTGFQIDMVDRCVSLLSPCPADDRWPEGSIVFAADLFDSADDLSRIMRRMIAEHMPVSWPGDRAVALGPDVTAEYEGADHASAGHAGARLRLAAPHATHTLTGDGGLRTLGRLLQAPVHTPDELAAAMRWHGWSRQRLRQTLDLLLGHGLLDEAPPA